jgi:hypothetical protein
LDRKRTPYLDRWKWWGPSFLIHALVAVAILYPFAPGKKTANSGAALHAIAVVFTPQPQPPTAPVTAPRRDSPKPASPATRTATTTVTASKTTITRNAPATPAKAEAVSEPMAIPRHLPKTRPAAPTMPPAPALETAKAPTTDNAPAPRLRQNGSISHSSKTTETNAIELNNNKFSRNDAAVTIAPASAAKADVSPGVTTSTHSKPATAPTLPDYSTAPSMATTGNDAALADAADMDHVKSWGQNVRGTLVRLTKGLQSRGSAKVAIRLARTGELIGVTFIEKSQNGRFNRELDRRIKTSGIFPAAPHGLVIDEMLFPIRLTVTR